MDKYIDDSIELGLEYDYNKINKIYNSIGIPKQYRKPLTKYAYDKSWIHVLLSKRNEGKTTNCLLYGLCQKKLYPKFSVCLIRQKKDMITLQKTRTLFDVILEYGYIDKIFKGKYNTLVYKSKAWYLAFEDEDGNVLEKDNNAFLILLDCEESDLYKSTLNVPFGDLILYDEFIPMRGWTHPDEFIWFMDILKTILRKRLSAHIFLCANNVDLEHRYFDEMGIYEAVQTLEEGKSDIVYSNVFNTPVFVSWISSDTVARKKENNRQIRQYFGFKNKKLNSIRGGGWSLREYPRIKILKTDEKIIQNRYIEVNDKRFLKIDVLKRDNSVFAWVHDCGFPTANDAIIYNLKNDPNPRIKRGFGTSKVDKFIFSLVEKGKVFYSTHGAGCSFEKYYNDVKKGGRI